MNRTLLILALGLVGYLISCVFQWRRLQGGKPKEDPENRD
jgi:hypothetical protein